MAVDKVLLECADNVLAEDDLELDGQVEEVFSKDEDDLLDFVREDPVAETEQLDAAGQVALVLTHVSGTPCRWLDVFKKVAFQLLVRVNNFAEISPKFPKHRFYR